MAGKIWEVMETTHGRVWFVECELARRLRRRILLAVDRSDSTSAAVDSFQSAATELARALDPGDTVALWVMGDAVALQEEFQIRNDADRLDLVQVLRTLKESPRGSWLRETWNAMRVLLAQPKVGFRDFPVVISDGEVFDAASDLPPLGAPLRWIPLPLPTLPPPQRAERREDFVRVVTETMATRTELKKALACPPASARLHLRSSGASRAVAFDENGTLLSDFGTGELDGLPVPRVMLIGGHLESAYVSYSAGPVTWRDDAFERVQVKWPIEVYLQSALRALTGGALRWDKSRLAALAAGAKPSFSCPRDAVPSRPGQLSCIQCGSFLLAQDPVELDQIHPLRWKFPLMNDGSVGDAVEADAEDNTDLPWTIKCDMRGRWLVLNLGSL